MRLRSQVLSDKDGSWGPFWKWGGSNRYCDSRGVRLSWSRSRWKTVAFKEEWWWLCQLSKDGQNHQGSGEGPQLIFFWCIPEIQPAILTWSWLMQNTCKWRGTLKTCWCALEEIRKVLLDKDWLCLWLLWGIFVFLHNRDFILTQIFIHCSHVTLCLISILLLLVF